MRSRSKIRTQNSWFLASTLSRRKRHSRSSPIRSSARLVSVLLSGTLLNSDVEYGEVDAEEVLRDDEGWAEAYRTGRILEIGSDLRNAGCFSQTWIGDLSDSTHGPTRSTSPVLSALGFVLSGLRHEESLDADGAAD